MQIHGRSFENNILYFFMLHHWHSFLFNISLFISKSESQRQKKRQKEKTTFPSVDLLSRQGVQSSVMDGGSSNPGPSSKGFIKPLALSCIGRSSSWAMNWLPNCTKMPAPTSDIFSKMFTQYLLTKIYYVKKENQNDMRSWCIIHV